MEKSRRVTKPASKPEVKLDDGLMAMIKRLKASKAKMKSEDRRSGLAQGEHWAEKLADYRLLDWLDVMGWHLDLDLGGPPEGANYAWPLASDLVYLTMGGPQYCTDEKIFEMVGKLFPDPDRSYSEAFVLGFIEGAVKKYRKVAGKI